MYQRLATPGILAALGQTRSRPRRGRGQGVGLRAWTTYQPGLPPAVW
jgi:hypothetical protein